SRRSEQHAPCRGASPSRPRSRRRRPGRINPETFADFRWWRNSPLALAAVPIVTKATSYCPISPESSFMALPLLIQGGMGAGVSGWRLAQSVAREGQLGVVSGTALDTILVRTLQLGDPEGHYRRALA